MLSLFRRRTPTPAEHVVLVLAEIANDLATQTLRSTYQSAYYIELDERHQQNLSDEVRNVFGVGVWKAAKQRLPASVLGRLAIRLSFVAAGYESYSTELEQLSGGKRGFKAEAQEYLMAGIYFLRRCGETPNSDFNIYLKRAGAEMFEAGYNRASKFIESIKIDS